MKTETLHTEKFGEKYYVAYTLRGEAPIMNLDAFETHELAHSFLNELVESRRAFSVAGVLRFSGGIRFSVLPN